MTEIFPSAWNLGKPGKGTTGVYHGTEAFLDLKDHRDAGFLGHLLASSTESRRDLGFTIMLNPSFGG